MAKHCIQLSLLAMLSIRTTHSIDSAPYYPHETYGRKAATTTNWISNPSNQQYLIGGASALVGVAGLATALHFHQNTPAQPYQTAPLFPTATAPLVPSSSQHPSTSTSFLQISAFTIRAREAAKAAEDEEENRIFAMWIFIISLIVVLVISLSCCLFCMYYHKMRTKKRSSDLYRRPEEPSSMYRAGSIETAPLIESEQFAQSHVQNQGDFPATESIYRPLGPYELAAMSAPPMALPPVSEAAIDPPMSPEYPTLTYDPALPTPSYTTPIFDIPPLTSSYSQAPPALTPSYTTPFSNGAHTAAYTSYPTQPANVGPVSTYTLSYPTAAVV